MAADNTAASTSVKLRDGIEAPRAVGIWEQVAGPRDAAPYERPAIAVVNQQGLRVQPLSFVFQGEHDGTRL